MQRFCDIWILTLHVLISLWLDSASNYVFKVNKRNTRTQCEICLKLTIQTPEWRVVLMSLLLTLNMFHTLFGQENAGWEFNIWYWIKIIREHYEFLNTWFFVNTRCNGNEYLPKKLTSCKLPLFTAVCIFVQETSWHLHKPYSRLTIVFIYK